MSHRREHEGLSYADAAHLGDFAVDHIVAFARELDAEADRSRSGEGPSRGAGA